MKIIFLFIGFLIVFVSCKNKNKELIVGKWQKSFNSDFNYYYELTFNNDSTGSEDWYNKVNNRLDRSKNFYYTVTRNSINMDIDTKEGEEKEELRILKLDNDSLKILLYDDSEIYYRMKEDTTE